MKRSISLFAIQSSVNILRKEMDAHTVSLVIFG